MARITPPADALRGAHLLREHLDARGLSIPGFAEQHNLCRLTLQKLVKGQAKRVSVDLAWSIEQATEGAVPMAAWLQPETAKAA